VSTPALGGMCARMAGHVEPDSRLLHFAPARGWVQVRAPAFRAPLRAAPRPPGRRRSSSHVEKEFRVMNP